MWYFIEVDDQGVASGGCVKRTTKRDTRRRASDPQFTDVKTLLTMQGDR